MALINIAERTIHCKLVYYGPGMGGKTTNLQYIHWQIPPSNKGELLSIATETERTLFFDCLPPEQLPIRGLHIRFHLYTVPGCVLYERTRLNVLEGVDGLVFVADSQRHKLQENLRSLNELKQGLTHFSKDIRTCPLVLQYNKRDVPNTLAVARLDQHLNHFGWQRFEAIANDGIGVMEAFEAICAASIDALQRPIQPTVSPDTRGDPDFSNDPETHAQAKPSLWSGWLQTLKTRMKL